ncbi:MAG: hydroxymethylglutaryl-CoA reductase [Flavobacteriales bacterium]|nr:hydroxymethylglutaryl-CoA reductase [Flavobacteriales bacterium]
MSINIDKAKKIFENLNEITGLEKLISNLSPNFSNIDFGLPKDNSVTSTNIRLEYLKNNTNLGSNASISEINLSDIEKLDGSIENFIGFATIPMGVAGPLRVNGSEAKGEFFIPLATTEGALVASYHRGAKAVSLSGGVTSICLTEGVRRSPLFGFEDMQKAINFLIWVTEQKEKFKEIAKSKTNHGRLIDVQLNMEGNHVILTFEYYTGDASGQNMVTICTDAICQYIEQTCPITAKYWYVEGNYSGDKKASAISFTTVRGKKVTAECVVKANVLASVLKTTANAVETYWRSSTVSVIQSGSIGAQGHFANGLAALFLATGQDVACVAEAAVGVTRMEVVNESDLYVSVTLPNLIVGTVGGGTKFSSQQNCLQMMDCSGQGKARKLAEIAGALLLCGELSIASALAEGHFTSAHQNLGRK